MVRSNLEQGLRCAHSKMAATSGELLRLWECVRISTHVGSVEPTNNAAERALRYAAIWRRISDGTDSTAGSRVEERVLSVIATYRQQKRGVLRYLWQCHQGCLDLLSLPTPLFAASPVGVGAGPMVALR
jgi:transposase